MHKFKLKTRNIVSVVSIVNHRCGISYKKFITFKGRLRAIHKLRTTKLGLFDPPLSHCTLFEDSPSLSDYEIFHNLIICYLICNTLSLKNLKETKKKCMTVMCISLIIMLQTTKCFDYNWDVNIDIVLCFDFCPRTPFRHSHLSTKIKRRIKFHKHQRDRK